MKLNFFSNKNNQTTTPPTPSPQKGRKNNKRNTKPVPVNGVDIKLYDTVPN